MAKVKFQLNHRCRRPDMIGDPGDVIEVTKAQVKYLLARHGGRLLDVAGAEAAIIAPTETAALPPARGAEDRSNGYDSQVSD